jgi:hypothetical protein
LANSYLSLWQTLTPWVARTVFHLSGLALVYRRTGSTDTTLDYVQEFCFLILALATTVVWSILDRKRKHYGRLHAWLRLLVRYTLSFTLFTYGLVKSSRFSSNPQPWTASSSRTVIFRPWAPSGAS